MEARAAAAAAAAGGGLEAEAREEGTEYCGRAERRTGRADAGRADAIRRSEATFISMPLITKPSCRPCLKSPSSPCRNHRIHRRYMTNLGCAASDNSQIG